MKAVIYARYSCDSQREESIEGQLRECREYAKRNGITILGEYIDRAMTGRNDDRPEFQRMIKDSYLKKFDILLVWKLDRFSRDLYDFAYNQKILNDNGVRLLSATEAIPDDPSGILLQTILIGQSVYYSKELSVKINRGLTENALNGKINGGTITYGYRLTKDRTYEIDEEQAAVVREIFTRYANGEKPIDISRDLTMRGFSTRYGPGIKINTVIHILKNRRYLGEYQFRDIFVKDAIPRIISDELFERVQQRKEKIKRAPALHKSDIDFILTTKMFCGDCGTSMAGESGTSRNKSKHYYYKCGNAKRGKGCKLRAVKKDWIEKIVIDHTLKFILDDQLINRIADHVLIVLSGENQRIPQLKSKLREIEKSIENMLNAIQQGIITSSTRERLEALEQSKQEVEERLCKEELKKPTITKDQIISYIKHFRDVDPNDLNACKQVIDIFINRIYLYKDRLLITYNYKDDASHEVSLEDFSEELGSISEKTLPPK